VLISTQADPAERQLVLVVENGAEGAVGLNITGNRVRTGMPVLAGGPDEKQSMRFVHKRTGHDVAASVPLGATGYAVRHMTASAEDKRLVGFLVKSVPSGSALVLGATVWRPAMLESEVAEGKWRETSADLFTLLGKQASRRIEAASKHVAPIRTPAAAG
jgi:putative AlgH/UPF0301 family transcriptional regulator